MYDNVRMKNVIISEKKDICLFCDHDFCKRLEVLLQSCIELNPIFVAIELYSITYFVHCKLFKIVMFYINIIFNFSVTLFPTTVST
jgi:hypothetical protein